MFRSLALSISTQYNQSDHFYKEMNPLDLKHGRTWMQRNLSAAIES